MKNLKYKTTLLSSLLILSACGGGSSSSGNSEANVTNQCQQQEVVSGTSLVNIVNGCDFNVNFRATSQIDSEPTIKNNIRPGESIGLSISLRLAERFIICRAPSLPNNKATRCT